MKTTEMIQKDVVDELAWDPKVDSSAIGVTVHECVVTLVGHVPNFAEKLAAEHAVKRILGVQAVVDELVVETGPEEKPLPDEVLANAALTALRWNVAVPQDTVTVVVNKGWIKLSGEVLWFFQSKAAENAVRFLPGVKGVTNLIVVKQEARATEVHEKIEAALRRNAELDANRIRVDVSEGTAILNGVVRTWAERDQAEKAAWSAPGVVTVRNELKIGTIVAP